MSLRALETNEPLERYLALTRQIRALERERDALKPVITEALYREPAGEHGEQYTDFGGYRIELASRTHYVYTEAVSKIEEELRSLKMKERKSGAAVVSRITYHPRCTPHEATREEEARERKASYIAAYLSDQGIQPADASKMEQRDRDTLAKEAGQRSPSEKTWSLVLTKLAA